MSTLVFLLEEPSAREMLKAIVPRLVPATVAVHYVAFEGKQDMHQQLGRKLRGWLQPDTRFIVVRDQDSGNCVAIKHDLQRICTQAGRPETLVRIACRELESFYLGDLAAVGQAFGLAQLARQQQSRRFRAPDQLGNASQELARLTGGRYQKLSGSRAIAPLLRLDAGNRSHSFNMLVTGIRRAADQIAGRPESS